MNTPPEPHGCFWTGCKVHVAPQMLMCRPHWFATPKDLRSRVWENYAAGQEDDETLRTPAYFTVLGEIRTYIERRQSVPGQAVQRDPQLPLL